MRQIGKHWRTVLSCHARGYVNLNLVIGSFDSGDVNFNLDFRPLTLSYVVDLRSDRGKLSRSYFIGS